MLKSLNLTIQSDTLTAEVFETIVECLRMHLVVRGIEGNFEKKKITIALNEKAELTLETCREIIHGALPRTLYYSVPEIMCASCVASIKVALSDKVESIDGNIGEKTVRIIPKPPYTNAQISEIIRDNAGFTKAVLTEEKLEEHIDILEKSAKNEEKFKFSIGGMLTLEDAKRIEALVTTTCPRINKCHVDYSTQILVVYANADQIDFGDQTPREELEHFLLGNLSRLKPNYRIDRILTPLRENRVVNKAQSYFMKGAINGGIALLMGLLSIYIPLPITLVGQLVGLGIGGAMLAVMWNTGKEFYEAAINQFTDKKPANMNTLIALGTGSAWCYSMLLCAAPWLFPVAALQYQFLAVNMILGIVNFGKGVRQIAEEHAYKQVKKLGDSYEELQPQMAIKRTVSHTEPKQYLYQEIPFKQIKRGDILVIKPNTRFPVECTILTHAQATLEQEVLTGEANIIKKRNEKVFTGSLLVNFKREDVSQSADAALQAGLIVRALCNGSDNLLVKIFKQLQETTKFNNQGDHFSDNRKGKSSGARLSNVDRIAAYFAPTIMLISFASAVGWWFFGPMPQLPAMIKSAMSVLLCACPCALGLASPIATTIGVYKLFGEKILVRDSHALEALVNVNTYVFDKTGTLTTPSISSDYFLTGEDYPGRQEILLYAASLERKFDHPIANCLQHVSEDVNTWECIDSQNKTGGVLGWVNNGVSNAQVHMGNQVFMVAEGILIPEKVRAEAAKNDKEGKSSIFIAIHRKCVGVLGLEHRLRKDAKDAIQALKEVGKDIYIYTGDNQATANSVAKQLGIEMPQGSVIGGLNAEQKQTKIDHLKSKGRKIAMVGDGLNDLLAMSSADVSIAIGTWTHAASQANISMQGFNFKELLVVSHETVNTIHQNLWWALCYNIMSIVAASGLLYPYFGVVLNPVAASIAMAFSSISVVFNSTLLVTKIDESLKNLKNGIINYGVAQGVFSQIDAYWNAIMAVCFPGLGEEEINEVENRIDPQLTAVINRFPPPPAPPKSTLGPASPERRLRWSPNPRDPGNGDALLPPVNNNTPIVEEGTAFSPSK